MNNPARADTANDERDRNMRRSDKGDQMGADELLRVSGAVDTREGATAEAIAALQEWAWVPLPQSYLDLLRTTNGAEGFVSEDSFLRLYRAEEVAQSTEGYGVPEFAPGLVLIGTDGSDTGYAFDTRTQPIEVKAIPFVGMSLIEAETVGSDFENFLRRLGYPSQ